MQVLPKLQQRDVLLELTSNSSETLSELCTVYEEKYGATRGGVYKHAFVFAVDCMERNFEGSGLSPDDCSLGNPLHAMAHIGLAPMCDGETRARLQESRACIEV